MSGLSTRAVDKHVENRFTAAASAFPHNAFSWIAQKTGSGRPRMLSRPESAASQAPPAARALSVTELNRGVRSILERGYPVVTVRGELSNFTRAASGHLYFVLKDAGAQVRCAMWKNRAGALDWQPRDGDAVVVRAAVTLFEARGEFQLSVESLARAGAGALFEAFQRLKEKLAREGLFDAERKRALPALPRAIAVISSVGAAALRDVLTTLRRRAPMLPVIVYPTPVQGENAAARIAAAIALANLRDETDVLIVCRGGGSIEDLWAFNEEVVARAIAGSRIPVVAGIGHETDFTIADFAADVRAPTPTAAAELAAPSRAVLLASLATHVRDLSRAIEAAIAGKRQRLDWAARELIAPAQRLAERRRQLADLGARLDAAASLALGMAGSRVALAAARLRGPRLAVRVMQVGGLAERHLRAGRGRLQASTQRLAALESALAHLDPMRVLARGYAVVRGGDGRTVRESAGLRAGDALELTLARGGALVRVEKPY